MFYNLIDNSLRHGGNGLTRIGVFATETSDGLTVLYEDDGEGIPPEQKEKLFTRGSGKTGGMGLFLVREILGITGISLSETGTAGNGARFEIRVPDGAYRSGGAQ